MQRVILLLIVTLVLTSGFVLAVPSFYVEESENFTIQISCSTNGNVCSTSSWCNATIYYPNGTILKNNSAMDNGNNGVYTLFLENNETTPTGEYFSNIVCVDGYENDTSAFWYEVNPTGIRPSDQRTESLRHGRWIWHLRPI